MKRDKNFILSHKRKFLFSTIDINILVLQSVSSEILCD
jgi:hypothetical protein